MSLVVVKTVREIFKKKGLKISKEAIQAINKELEKLCLKSADNVMADKLKIVKASHVPELDALLDSSSQSL